VALSPHSKYQTILPTTSALYISSACDESTPSSRMNLDSSTPLPSKKNLSNSNKINGKSSSATTTPVNVGGALPELVLDYYDDKSNQPSRKSSYRQSPSLSSPLWVNSLDTYIEEATTSSATRPFSLLTWNILAQSLYRNPQFDWHQRLDWIIDHIHNSNADVVCLQEVEWDSYHQQLLPRMKLLGYQGAVQGDSTPQVHEIKRRKGKSHRAHLVATFWNEQRFRPCEVLSASIGTAEATSRNKDDEHTVLAAHMARGRTMTTLLQDISMADSADDNNSKPKKKQVLPTLAVINCHLEGHPRQYAARIRQLQHAMDDLAKRVLQSRHIVLHGMVLAGDFNCELQSSACSTYLRLGMIGRKGGLGGVHGPEGMVLPPSLLESQEALEILHPVLEWGLTIPNDDLEQVAPHPFRRTSMASAYPVDEPIQNCFTYCANPHRPVAGLDQVWYSGSSLTRLALKRPLATRELNRQILSTGLPAPGFPSDHLPIGTILEWRLQNKASNQGPEFRELIIAQDRVVAPPKPKSPIMAYAELDMLLVTLPYDTDKQRDEVENLMDDSDKIQVPPNGQKPTPEQLSALKDIRNRKQDLFLTASPAVQPMLQRVFKLKKQVTAYEQEHEG
jgi:mRNA deadenylase 3'-5' endonuclease subunit Ccr4